MSHFALFSINDTRGVVEFTKVLNSLGWTVICTPKPYSELNKLGLDVVSVNDFVNFQNYQFPFPPTLHPKIEQALTVKDADDRIELVYDITYGLEEGNDVGGHTLLALAVKGNRLPVSNYRDMVEITNHLQRNSEASPAQRCRLINLAKFKIASHYAQLLLKHEEDNFDILLSKKYKNLLNGENPYQVPSGIFDLGTKDPMSIVQFRQLTKVDPCFTNMADLDCLNETLCKLAMAFKINRGNIPFIAVAAKHGNPCGIGIDWQFPQESVEKALWGNPLAVWGGELIVNFPINGEIATQICSSEKRKKELGKKNWMLDVIAAPDVDGEGEKVISQKRKNTKLFINPSLKSPSPPSTSWIYRYVRGALLRQPGFSYVLDLNKVRFADRAFSEGEIDSAIIAWACCFTSNHGGNEVAIAADGSLLGAGGGPSTVEAAEIAVARSLRYHKGLLDRSIFAADAFFPFTDAPEMLCTAGCIGGVVPSGGVCERQVMEFFKDKNLNIAYLSEEFRGFCRH